MRLSIADNWVPETNTGFLRAERGLLQDRGSAKRGRSSFSSFGAGRRAAAGIDCPGEVQAVGGFLGPVAIAVGAAAADVFAEGVDLGGGLRLVHPPGPATRRIDRPGGEDRFHFG